VAGSSCSDATCTGSLGEITLEADGPQGCPDREGSSGIDDCGIEAAGVWSTQSTGGAAQQTANGDGFRLGCFHAEVVVIRRIGGRGLIGCILVVGQQEAGAAGIAGQRSGCCAVKYHVGLGCGKRAGVLLDSELDGQVVGGRIHSGAGNFIEEVGQTCRNVRVVGCGIFRKVKKIGITMTGGAGGVIGINAMGLSTDFQIGAGGEIDVVVAGTARLAARLGLPVVGLGSEGQISRGIPIVALAAVADILGIDNVVKSDAGVVIAGLGQLASHVDLVDHGDKVAGYFAIGDVSGACEDAVDRSGIGAAISTLGGMAHHAVLHVATAAVGGGDADFAVALVAGIGEGHVAHQCRGDTWCGRYKSGDKVFFIVEVAQIGAVVLQGD